MKLELIYEMIFLKKIKIKSIFAVLFILILSSFLQEEAMCGAIKETELTMQNFEEARRQAGELTEDQARIVLERLREEFPEEYVMPRLLQSLIIVVGLHLTLYLIYTYGNALLNTLQELPQQIYEFFALNARNMVIYQIQNIRNPEHLLRSMEIMREVQQQVR